ncbi:MAG: ankyrin repeat domain-containing protein [Candidatus Hydrogenedentes bacterium]|nr:ankyrin repeat domain-containing protein [Candidatus Hydrogenedentota bacterium]
MTGIITLYLKDYVTLEKAVENGDLRMTYARLRFNLEGVDANTGCVRTYTSEQVFTGSVLPISAKNGNIEIAMLLLDSGADVNAFNGCATRDALSEAVQNHQQTMVEFLLDRGADSDNALEVASDTEQLETAELLIRRGANPTRGLIAAARRGNLEILLCLLDAGADPFVTPPRGNMRTFLGNIPTDSAAGRAMDLIAMYMLDVRTVRGCICAGRVDLLKDYLESGYDPNEGVGPGGSGQKGPLLHVALHRLLQAGYLLNLPAGATEQECLDAIRLLLEYGADPEACDSNESRPLALIASAVCLYRDRNLELSRWLTAAADLLIAYGADPAAHEYSYTGGDYLGMAGYLRTVPATRVGSALRGRTDSGMATRRRPG